MVLVQVMVVAVRMAFEIRSIFFNCMFGVFVLLVLVMVLIVVVVVLFLPFVTTCTTNTTSMNTTTTTNNHNQSVSLSLSPHSIYLNMGLLVKVVAVSLVGL